MARFLRYLFVLPVLWGVTAAVSYFHPGDEYGIFFFANIIGFWPLLIIDESQIGHVRDAIPWILVSGVSVMALCGWALDRLRVSGVLWCCLYLIFGIFITGISLLEFPSYDRAMSKNGSLTAYVAGGANMGMMLAVVLGLGIGVFKKLFAGKRVADA